MIPFRFISRTIDDYFDKVFYINLSKDIERNIHTINQLKNAGISNYERVEAVQLTYLPPRDQYRNFIKNDPKYILGSLSCRASHIRCIKLAKERSYKKVLILEDDVVFLRNPNELLNENTYNLNEWDMLYFGGLVEIPFRNQIVCAHAYGVTYKLYDEILCMADASGMEIDNFYAKVIQHMSYNYNSSGRYNIRMMFPFNSIIQNKTMKSNIQK